MRAKVDKAERCRGCGERGRRLEAAHIIPRSRIKADPALAEHENNCVPLCRDCHNAYDSRTLDLLPYLTLAEQGHAALLVGLVEAIFYTTGRR